ncbi:MAG: anaerobic sulfatase maturase [Eubacteriales bacterium]|nr:anaerobic sulfatase maturase [Eubacteriales bacterium]
MRNLSVLIKPMSGMCNLNCDYCFYQDEIRNRSEGNYAMMNDETMKAIVQKAFHHSKGGKISFCFQGGEPMLAGVEYYKKFVALVRAGVEKNQIIDYSIQTNGTILNEDWINFFKENQFLVGVSLDGELSQHDYFRKYINGEGSFVDVMKTIDLMMKNDIPVNALAVITNQNVSRARQTYDFLKCHNLTFMQFIPVIDSFRQSHQGKGLRRFSISPKEYEGFLKNLFDAWYKDIMDEKTVSIRLFENVLMMMMGYEPESCDMKGHCSIQYVIESNGNVYPCDFYCLDEYRIGNINQDSFEDLSKAVKGMLFVKESYNQAQVCVSCKWRVLCRGGCRRYREMAGVQNGTNLFKYCQSYRKFFEYSYPRFNEIVKVIRQKANQ